MLRFTDTNPAASYASLAREAFPTVAKAPEPGSAAPEAHRPATSPAEPPPPVAAHSPVRDIRLQVGGPERHADVRLTERAGEVHVAVRTPDSRLAGALREDLPALAARLEATGFRAEAWHPGTAASETRLVQVQPASAGTPSDPPMPDGHGGQQQQSRERGKAPEAEPAAESQPKDFSWLLSSLR